MTTATRPNPTIRSRDSGHPLEPYVAFVAAVTLIGAVFVGAAHHHTVAPPPAPIVRRESTGEIRKVLCLAAALAPTCRP